MAYSPLPANLHLHTQQHAAQQGSTTVNKLQTFATGGLMALGLTLGLTFTVGDAASTDADPTVRTIVPTVDIVQPGVTVQGRELAAETPQPGIVAPDSTLTTSTTSGVDASSVAALALQPGVTGSDGRPVAANSSGSAADWTALTFAAGYDACAARSLHNAIDTGAI